MHANNTWGIVFDGNGIIYNGTLTVWGNHVGTSGGIIQINNGFATLGSGISQETFHLNAEENGSGGVLLQDNSSGLFQVDGAVHRWNFATVFNGSGL